MQASMYFCHCLLYSYTDEIIQMSNHMIVFAAFLKKKANKKDQFTLDSKLLSSAKRAAVWIAVQVYNTLSAGTARGSPSLCHSFMQMAQVCQK